MGESSASECEEGEIKEDRSNKIQRFLFPSDEKEELFKAIYDTLELEEPEDKELSVHNLLYAGLQFKQTRTFPVHASLKETVLQEWKDPEKRVLSQESETAFSFLRGSYKAIGEVSQIERFAS